MKKIITLPFIIIVTLMIAGCGEPNPYNTIRVEGVVTLDGVPVQGVSVNLNPRNGEGYAAGGLTDVNGQFTVTTGGAPVGSGAKQGSYEVTFHKIDSDSSGLSIAERQKDPAKAIVLIPKKYENPKTSGIAPINVEPGKPNKFTFELKSK